MVSVSRKETMRRAWQAEIGSAKKNQAWAPLPGVLALAQASVAVLNSLDSLARLRTLVEFFIEQHNTQMPHSAFAGQTPDEMYFGTAADLPTELAVARSQARTARLAANRAMSCDRCIGRPFDLPALEIPA